jgi:hypothetical protein
MGVGVAGVSVAELQEVNAIPARIITVRRIIFFIGSSP